MLDENTTTDLHWLALSYVAGEMSETEAAAFELRLAEDSLACEAVSAAVTTSLAVRAAFEAEAGTETPSAARNARQNPELRWRGVASRSSRSARWMSLGSAAVAVVVALSIARFQESDVTTVNADQQRQLAVLWTQAGEVLPEAGLGSAMKIDSVTEEVRPVTDDRVPAVDLVDVPEWLLVALESQKTNHEILEN